MASGKQKGCKKILVLYTNFGKNRKPEKTNWVMHQYHLGQHEEEKEGELVVSKIFYQTQPRQCNWSDRSLVAAETGFEVAASGSCSSMAQADEMSPAGGGVGASISSFSSLDIQHLKSDHFGFGPFRITSFDEVGLEEGSTGRKMGMKGRTSGGACSSSGEFELRDHHHQLVVAHNDHHRSIVHHHLPTTAFHISNHPSHQISAIISPPPPPPLLLLDHDSFHHPSPIIIQNQQFHQQVL